MLNIWIRALSGWSLCTEVIALLWRDDDCISVKDGTYSIVFHICVRDKSRMVLTPLLFCKTLLVQTSVCKCLSDTHTTFQPAPYFRYLSVLFCNHSKTGFPFHFCMRFSSGSPRQLLQGAFSSAQSSLAAGSAVPAAWWPASPPPIISRAPQTLHLLWTLLLTASGTFSTVLEAAA